MSSSNSSHRKAVPSIRSVTFFNLDYALEFVDNFFLYENQSVSF